MKTGLFPQIAYLIDFVSEIAWLIQPFVFLLKCRIASNSDGMRFAWSFATERGRPMTTESDDTIVLVIDDDRVLADTLAEILKRHGYRPIALYSGEEALELAQRFRPDVILSDIRMSRLDGVETARRIRLLHPDCRVILFTAQTVSTAMGQTIRRLGFELLQRPLRPEDVLTALRTKPSEEGTMDPQATRRI